MRWLGRTSKGILGASEENQVLDVLSSLVWRVAGHLELFGCVIYFWLTQRAIDHNAASINMICHPCLRLDSEDTSKLLNRRFSRNTEKKSSTLSCVFFRNSYEKSPEYYCEQKSLTWFRYWVFCTVVLLNFIPLCHIIRICCPKLNCLNGTMSSSHSEGMTFESRQLPFLFSV